MIGSKIQIFFSCIKDSFGDRTTCIFRNIVSKFQQIHIFVKSRKVQNTAQSTKLADGIYPKLHIFQHANTERRELAWISYSHGL